MKTQIENSPWIQTVSGRKFPLADPDVGQIDIVDIAHALSLLVRFNGQCTRFYSVAEHSVHVSREIAPELALAGLLHDAAEAYLGDVPSPFKGQLSQFSAFEHSMEGAIGKRFGIDPALFKSTELKRADVQLLVDEKAVLMVGEAYRNIASSSAQLFGHLNTEPPLLTNSRSSAASRGTSLSMKIDTLYPRRRSSFAGVSTFFCPAPVNQHGSKSFH